MSDNQKNQKQTNQTNADGYYSDDLDLGADELDLSFLDEEENK